MIMKTRMALHLKIISSSLFLASIALSILIFVVCIMMEKWYIVNHVEPRHIYIVYETIFSMGTVFLFSSLFCWEIDKHILAWLLSTPLQPLRFLMEKWVIGFGCMLLLFVVPLLLIHTVMLNLNWSVLLCNVLAPSVFLGHFTLCLALFTRSTFAGISIPLLLWGLEIISRGLITGSFTLFAITFGSDFLLINRMVVWIFSIVWLIFCWLFLRRRNLFT